MKKRYLLVLLLTAACTQKSSDDSPEPPQTTVTTLAGDGEAGLVDGSGPTARFDYLWGATLDAQGNVYVADHGNGRIRRITPAGQVSTYADFGRPANFAEGPVGVAMSPKGVLYVSMEGQGPLLQVSASGVVSDLPGEAANTSFRYVRSLATDAQGNLYVAELLGAKIDKIDPAGNVTVLAGSGVADHVDGLGTQAQFWGPSAIAVDKQGTVYVADGSCIRRITPAGQVTTIAGSSTIGEADGNGTAAQFDTMYGLTVDANGILYLSDRSTVRRITPAGEVTTLAGGPLGGHADGPASSALFGGTCGITGDPATGLYVCDFGNYVRKVVTK
ncbi:hypothetical protein FY528_04795 [Hymenobacter lutimineralis]|uniref:Teneurin NHL domain-containing protein n=1 Tax=Hymenobacter lutimineralis TaxID=2606448 RepID=A0A5D6VD02_9BACT|nr:hypothetical protein [Hymenobacter lutimineralis]TYZ12618.1 hypothetical protein FY528_04795 [Hymenobacter lutimineralis]